MKLFSKTATRLMAAFLTVLCMGAHTTAQTYWGMTATGGDQSIGTIFTVDETGAYNKVHDFTLIDGLSPKGDLMQAGNGKFYGVTESGGSNGVGIIFEFDPNTNSYTTLYNMSLPGGTGPIRGLVQAGNGRLYGMCAGGGSGNAGTIFEFNINTNGYIVRHHFNTPTTGRTPRGRFIEASNGLLYGVTQLGGANNRGTLFSFNPVGNNTTKIHDFDLVTGGQPFTGPIQATNGRLYGTTQIGGSASGGVVYEFVIGTSTYTPIQHLDATTGRLPIGELMQAANGAIYGTTTAGGTSGAGTIFRVDPGPNTFTKEEDLVTANGLSPFGKLMQAANGLLYGMTDRGGNNDKGVVYSFNTATSTYNKLADLDTEGLASPWGGFIASNSTTLLGMCSEAGSGNGGALFSFNINTNALTELVPMAFTEGNQPKGRLIAGPNGKLYGLTSAGGANSEGIVFSIDPATNIFTRLADFSSSTGTFPLGTMALSGGKFYGLCNEGGTFAGGTIFEFDPNTNALTKKVNLDGNTGSTPLAGFIPGSNGKLYTMMSEGGVNALGCLTEYDPVANTVMRLQDLSNTLGTEPKADLLQASNGKFYGTASLGGQFGDGTLFEYDLNTSTFAVLYDFLNIFEGGNPSGKLVEASDGKLYGVASDGAGFFNGCIYSWDPVTSTFTLEYDLEDDDGSSSESSLIEGTDGKLYGTATQGGVADLGTVFRYTPGGAFDVLEEFATISDGRFPFDGLTLDPATSSTVQLNIKMFLEGPFNSGTALMNDDLRTLIDFPLTEPYTSSGYTHMGEGGGETINASVLSTTGNNAIVDWVVVELRDKNNNATVVNTRSCLVQRDGDVVDLDGTSLLGMGVADDDYYVAVRHRNHLGVMTASVVALSSASAASIDFTDGSTPTFGTAAQKTVGSSLTSWAGNVNGNGELKYTGLGNDRDPILVQVGGSVPTNTVTGYLSGDVTLNGEVKYTGLGNDRDPILVNIGGSVPTAVKAEQLP